MVEIHLSHNMLTLRGATALLEALPVPSPAAPAAAEAAGAAAGEAAGDAAADELRESGGSGAGEGEAEAQLPAKPLWLRLEWNRVSLGGLMQVRGWLGRLVVMPLCSAVHQASSSKRCICALRLCCSMAAAGWLAFADVPLSLSRLPPLCQQLGA